MEIGHISLMNITYTSLRVLLNQLVLLMLSSTRVLSLMPIWLIHQQCRLFQAQEKLMRSS